MSLIGLALRRAAFRTPAVATAIGAAVMLALLPPPVSATGTGATAGSQPADGGDQGESDDRQGSITGVVVGADGRRFLGVIVQLHRAESDGRAGPALRPAYTGVDGRYRFDGLEPGCYRVVVDAPAGTAFADDSPDDDHLTCLDGRRETAELRSVANPEAAGARALAGSDIEPATIPNRTIEIVHLGHHLGQLEPSTLDLELAGVPVQAEVGGWPRVVTAIASARPVDAPESTITVNTGGVLSGSPLAHLFGGAADAALFEQACFDYLAPSPEDRARSEELATFVHFLTGGPCPTTVLDPDASPRPGSATTDPAVAIRAVGTGAVGLVTVAPGPGSGPGADPVAATEARVRQLEANGTSTIVVLSGLGLAADRALAGRLPAIDAIVGSGAGSLLGDVDDLGLTSTGPYPDRERNAEGDPVCLGHTGDRAKALGVLTIELDPDGRVVDCGGRIEFLVGRWAAAPTGAVAGSADDGAASGRAIDRALADHPTLTAVSPDRATSLALDRWNGVRDVLLDDPVATVAEDLCRTTVPGRSVGLLCRSGGRLVDTTAPRADAQRLVADAFRHRASQLGPTPIALIDSQTVARPIDAGPLTTIDAYRLLPTGSTLAVVELSGEQLATILAERLAAAVGGMPGAYPHTSGLRFSTELSRTDQPRIGPIERLDDAGRWEAIEPSASYRVVVTDRLLADDLASPTLAAAAADGRVIPTTIGTAEALLDYVDDVLGGVVVPPVPEPAGDAG